MSLFTRHSTITGPTAAELIPRRPSTRHGAVAVTSETAKRHSAVWACLRLRANLISTLPVDVFRNIDSRPFEVPKPPVLVNPGGERVDILEWMYSTQVDLDSGGNTFGIITARDGRDLPARIDLVPLEEVVVEVRKGELKWIRIAGQKFDPKNVWHEKQYTKAGLHVGLSPVAYAAWAIGEYLSIVDFALEWFGNSGIPAQSLKNNKKIVDRDEAAKVKEIYKATVSAGDVFVHGMDWDLNMIQAKVSDSDWIEAKDHSIADIARFFDCPGDTIDAAVRGANITYARVDQRQLQLLVNHLGPAITRREAALNRLLPAPRYVKLNTKALLRLDAKTQAEIFKLEIDSRTRPPSEVRALSDLPPLTEDQYAEFDRLFGNPNRTPNTPTTGVTP